MKKPVFLIAAAACAALLAAPVLAQTGKPMANMPADHGKAAMKDGKATAKKTAKHKRSCYDYAWESQDMKDCLAKQGNQPKKG